MEGILRLRDQGACIIFSSHNMANDQDVCELVIMIHNGEQKIYGSINDVSDDYGKTRLYVQAEGWDQEALTTLEGVESVSQLTTGEYKLILTDENVGPELFKTISK